MNENPFEKLRMPGVRDFGEDSVSDIIVIVNDNKEYLGITIGKHGRYYTFGCKVRSMYEDIDIDIHPTCEAGLFENEGFAKLYALGYLYEHRHLLTPSATQEVVIRVSQEVLSLVT